AFYIEMNVGGRDSSDSDYYSYVISADDGGLLFRNNLTVGDSFSYRVWADAAADFLPADGPQGISPTPHPTGLPDGFQAAFVAPSLLTLQNGPLSTNDPWLPPGSTQTTGNNVEAYGDVAAPDGFSAGDLRATNTSANTFDRTYDTSLSPQARSTPQVGALPQL